jgi:hypothetical protein
MTCTTCTHCGQDWELESFTLYGVDVRSGRGDRAVHFYPCCSQQADDVAWQGYAAAYGRELIDVVQEIIGYEHTIREITEADVGPVVCRLLIDNPTVTTDKSDKHGHAKAASPRGWQSQVFADVDEYHRHHPAPQGWKFGVAVDNGGVRVGVATVGRPVSRVLQDKYPDMLEVTRVCTYGHPALRANAVSKLYAEAARQAKVLGYDRLVTYTLHGVESGDSLRASGWTCTGITDAREGGHSWRCAARPNASEAAPTGAKVRWERGLSKSARRAVRRRQIVLPTATDELAA